ncbi:DUF2845 domain-containing protein [Pseudomonas sp. NA-150]|uniref:DUF2845 domain-containing protein n=1 Tax=Pseudomonas sp. NA-150 TaxID=3367525 RepID=UPI0037C76ABF
MPKPLARILTVLGLLVAACNLHASERCPSGLINEGDTPSQVIQKCGEPAQRAVTPPAEDSDGNVLHKAVTVEQWTYGPTNGMYRHLRFIDGKLMQISSERN